MRLQSRTTLQAIMNQYDLSLAGVAKDAGCSRAFISHLVAGRKSSCTPELAQAIANAVGAPLDLLFFPSDTSVARHISKTSLPILSEASPRRST